MARSASRASSTRVTPDRSATLRRRSTPLSTSTWPCVTTAAVSTRGDGFVDSLVEVIRKFRVVSCVSGEGRTPGCPLARGALSLRPRPPAPASRALRRRSRAVPARGSRGRGRRRFPCATSARPASNCGFTRTTASQPGAASSRTGGSAVRTEMNDTSQTTSCGANGSSVSARAFVRSNTTTRGSSRSFGCELPVADVDRDHARRHRAEAARR